MNNENSFMDSEVSYRFLFNNMPGGLAYFRIVFLEDKPVDLIYLAVNPAFERITGSRNVAGKKISEIIPSLFTENPELKEIFEKIVSSGQMEKFEICLNSMQRWYEVTIHCPEPGYLVAVFDVIDERKSTETAMKEREFWLKESQRIGRIGSYLLDITSDEWISSDTLNEIFGIKEGYLKTLESWNDLVHPEQRQEMLDYFLMTVLGKKESFNKEYRIIRKDDGNVRWVWGLGELSYDAAGNPVKMIGVIQDITDRVLTEKALQTSEQRLRKIFEGSPIGIAISGPDFKFMSVNEAFCTMTEYTEQELTRLTFREITHPEDKEKDILNITRLMKGEIPLYKTEKRYRRKDGTYFWGSLSASLIRDDKGKFIHIMALVENINDRKLAEQEVEQWKNHYEVVAVTSGQAVYDYDLSKGTIQWGGETEKVLGYTSQEIGHITLWESLIHPDDREEVVTILDNQIRNRGILNVRYRFRHKDGRYLSIHDKADIVVDASGNPTSLVGMMQDITEIVIAQKKLEEKEQQYRKLFDLSPDGISLENLQGDILDANDAYCRMTGYSKDDLIGKNARIFIPPGKHYHDLQKNISKILAGKTLQHEVININKAGKLMTVELRETLIRLPDGSDGILTVSNDITKRNQAEQVLKESQAQLKVFAEHLHTIREEERVDIARELHDNLGQNLSAIKMDICMLTKKLADLKEVPGVTGMIQQAGSMIPMIDSTIDQVRKISGELRPQLLDELGLIPAIERHVEEFGKRSGISCVMINQVKKVTVDRNHAVGIFRILQEALTNVMRHAAARSVVVSITGTKGSIVFEVADDGIGIKPARIHNIKSIGILGMRERAMLLGGELAITSKKGLGTKVMLTIPYNTGKR